MAAVRKSQLVIAILAVTGIIYGFLARHTFVGCYRSKHLTTHSLRDASTTLVSGGTGLIGGEVILSLARAGHRVRAVVRAQCREHARHRVLERLRKSCGYQALLGRLIEAVPGDSALELFGADRDIGKNVGTIIHCAANTSFSEREHASIWATNVGGARHVIDVRRRWAPDARLVFVSTASVVTNPTNTCLTEDAAFAGHENTYTLSKREAERIVTAADIDAVIVRPSIVLSRGVDDRAMARSILWALPIMKEIGAVPIHAEAAVDVVPADFVAAAIVRLAFRPRLAHRVYHISAGREAHTFAEILREIAKAMPEYRDLRLTGANGLRPRGSRRLFRPIDAYLPFVNAGVRYANDRLRSEIGDDGRPQASIDYIPQLLGLISREEAFAEMAKP
jgi:nucleoside-diphosphate-sugar epimerase